MLFSIVVWFILCVLIGLWAEKWYRSSVKWAIISLFISPLIGALILACMGKNKKAIEKEKREVIERKKAFKERLNKTWKEALSQNGFSQYLENLEKNGIDNFDTLSALTDYDLEKIGMTNIGERKKFMLFIKDISTGKIKAKTEPITQISNG
jgi:hypothetical protein